MPKVERINQLYGRPGNIIFAEKGETIELVAKKKCRSPLAHANCKFAGKGDACAADTRLYNACEYARGQHYE